MSTWPQWVYAGMITFNVSMGLVKAGEEGRPKPAGIAMIAALISTTLLYFGGFWSAWGFQP